MVRWRSPSCCPGKGSRSRVFSRSFRPLCPASTLPERHVRSTDGRCERSACTAAASSSEGQRPPAVMALLDPAVQRGFARAASLRIAMLAPPWISVPPPGYGGVESVVSTLTEALVRRGHDVTLFCAPGSVSSATVVTLLDDAAPRRDRALAVRGRPRRAGLRPDRSAPATPIRFDVIHDHCGFTGLAMANRIETPLVHTLHGPFTADTAAFYAHHGHKGDARRHQPRAARIGAARAAARSARSPTRSTCGPGRCRSARATTCSGSAGSRPRRARIARSPPLARSTCRSCWPA